MVFCVRFFWDCFPYMFYISFKARMAFTFIPSVAFFCWFPCLLFDLPFEIGSETSIVFYYAIRAFMNALGLLTALREPF